MRILICGDRYWSNIKIIDDFIKSLPKDTVIIEGGCRGADSIAGYVAKKCGLKVEVYPADWNKHGKAAGPIRNAEMLNKGKPDLVVAFHDNFDNSKGTKHMVDIALNKNVEVQNRTTKGEVFIYDFKHRLFVNISCTSDKLRKLLKDSVEL